MKFVLLSFVLSVIAPTLLSSAAHAATGEASVSFNSVDESTSDNELSRTMCRVMKIITGKAGKAFAAFAIISVGIGFFTGKVSWGLMIGVAAGIAAMFGAPSIVSAITGKTTYSCDGN